MSRAGITLATFLLLAVRPARSSGQDGQRIRGATADSATQTPLAGVAISVRTSDSGSERLGLSDSTGRFAVPVPLARTYLLTARRIGYRPITFFLDSSRSQAEIIVEMVATPALLATVQSTAPMTRGQRTLEHIGFNDRRQIGIGKFIDAAAIAREKPRDLTSLLRPFLKGCTMIFVDGIRLLALRDVDLETVLGIEIYASNVEAPMAFQNPIEGAGRCGSIVVWRAPP